MPGVTGLPKLNPPVVGVLATAIGSADLTNENDAKGLDLACSSGFFCSGVSAALGAFWIIGEEVNEKPPIFSTGLLVGIVSSFSGLVEDLSVL